MSRFRILAVTGSMPVGGASTFLVNLAEGMTAQGHGLEVVVMSTNSHYRDELAAAGATVHHLERDTSIYEDRIAEVYRIAALCRPRLILSCLSAESFEVLRYVPRGVVRAGMVQSDDPGVYRMVGHFAPWVDVMVGVSETIQRRLAAMPCFAKTRCAYIPYGIAFPPCPERGRGGGPLRVIYAGRLGEEQKRISRVSEVVRTLANGDGRFEFTIAGAGPQEAWLRERIEGLPGVVFAGVLSNAETRLLFGRQDVFLLLSDFEGLPLALLEAMGMGCVPVVSDLESGMREVVDESCGIRVPVGDVSAAVAALQSLAQDRLRLLALGAAAAQRVRVAFAAEQMAARYLALADGAPSNEASWQGRLRRIATPKDVQHRWLYAPPFRMLRRIRKSWATKNG